MNNVVLAVSCCLGFLYDIVRVETNVFSHVVVSVLCICSRWSAKHIRVFESRINISLPFLGTTARLVGARVSVFFVSVSECVRARVYLHS